MWFRSDTILTPKPWSPKRSGTKECFYPKTIRTRFLWFGQFVYWRERYLFRFGRQCRVLLLWFDSSPSTNRVPLIRSKPEPHSSSKAIGWIAPQPVLSTQSLLYQRHPRKNKLSNGNQSVGTIKVLRFRAKELKFPTLFWWLLRPTSDRLHRFCQDGYWRTRYRFWI